MVNTVEREAVQAEWENWLLDENERCDQAGAMLRTMKESAPTSSASSDKKSKKAKKQDDKQKKLGHQEMGEEDTRALKDWYKEYCGSCRADRETVFGRRDGVTLA